MKKATLVMMVCLLILSTAVSAKSVVFKEDFLKEGPDGTMYQTPGIQLIENNTVEYHHCNYLKPNVYVCDGYIIANRGYIIMKLSAIDTMLESTNKAVVLNGMAWKKLVANQRPVLLPRGGTE